MSVNDTPTGSGAGPRKDEGRVEGLRDRAADAYASAREKAIEAYDSGREGAVAAGRKASDTVADAPLIAIGAGLAAGALAALLIPKTKAEQKLLQPVGEKITGAGKAAAQAARTAGREALSERNLTPEAGKGVVQTIVDGLGEAARASGQAALGAVRESR